MTENSAMKNAQPYCDAETNAVRASIENYVLGNSAQEQKRLKLQARFLEKDRSRPGPLELPHRAHNVGGVTMPVVAVSKYRNPGRIRDPAHAFRHFSHREQPHVRRP
jgi:hypothetical protein